MKRRDMLLRRTLSSITLFLLIPAFFLAAAGCSAPLSASEESAAVLLNPDRVPAALKLNRGKPTELPSYDKDSPQPLLVDLRGCDLSLLTLHDKEEVLLHADFDTRTIWPYWLPEGYDPKRIMQYGKNPGLNIRELHREGITGRGIGIAVIGEPILTDHIEYKDSLRFYADTGIAGPMAAATGCAVLSAAVGNTTGVAPDASAYYIVQPRFLGDSAPYVKKPAGYSADRVSEAQKSDLAAFAESVKQILEINRKLAAKEKIRVICVAEELPYAYGTPLYPQIERIVEQAGKEGVFVISNLLYDTSNREMDFNGLGRNPLSDPGRMDAYGPGFLWAGDFYSFARYGRAGETLLVPMDSRSAAAPTGPGDYAFYRIGELRMCIGYIGGLYALMCQVKPDLTPQEFWRAALRTGKSVKVHNHGIEYPLRKVVDPQALYRFLKS